MTKGNKRMLSLLTAFALVISVFTLLPAGALKASAEPIRYGLFVDGVEVTSENCSDILGGNEVSYDPAQKKLYLKAHDYKSGNTDAGILNTGVDGLTIVPGNANSNGNNQGVRGYIYGIKSLKDLTIASEGKLQSFSVRVNDYPGDHLPKPDVQACAIYMGANTTLTISNVNVYATVFDAGDYGLFGEPGSKIKIEDKGTLAADNNTKNPEKAIISGFTGGLSMPEHYTIKSDNGQHFVNGTVLNGDGSPAKFASFFKKTPLERRGTVDLPYLFANSTLYDASEISFPINPTPEYEVKWFIDKNGNGDIDNGEEISTDTVCKEGVSYSIKIFATIKNDLYYFEPSYGFFSSNFSIQKTYDTKFIYGDTTSTATQVYTYKPVGKCDLGIKIAGVEVNTDNFKDVLGGGKVSVDPKTNTVTFHRNITCDAPVLEINKGVISRNNFGNFKITATAPVKLTSNNSNGFELNTSTYTQITGKKPITIVAKNGSGIKQTESSGSLGIMSGNVTINANRGLDSPKETAFSVTVRNSYLKIDAKYAAMWNVKGGYWSYIDGASFVEEELITPAEGEFKWVKTSEKTNDTDNGFILCTNSGSYVKTVSMAPKGALDLYVCGVQVTDANKNDILGTDPSSNTYKRAMYYVLNNVPTLWINIDVDGGSEPAIISRVPNLKILLNGSKISSKESSAIVIDGVGNSISSKSTTDPSNKSTISAPNDYAIYLSNDATLTFSNAYLDIEGNRAVATDLGNTGVYVNDSKISAKGTEAAIGGVMKGIFLNGCHIESPKGGKIAVPEGSGVNAYYVCSTDGRFAKNVTIDLGAPSDRLVGDVNEDGKITADDAIIVARLAAGFKGYAEKYDSEIADMNGDKKVSADDAIIIARYAAGYNGYEKKYTRYI